MPVEDGSLPYPRSHQVAQLVDRRTRALRRGSAPPGWPAGVDCRCSRGAAQWLPASARRRRHRAGRPGAAGPHVPCRAARRPTRARTGGMIFTNRSGLPAAWTLGFRADGRELLVVVVKASFTLPLRGEAAELAPEQVPLVETDTFSGEPGLSAPCLETDFAHQKPGCDVLLLGSAYAPRGPARPALRGGVARWSNAQALRGGRPPGLEQALGRGPGVAGGTIRKRPAELRHRLGRDRSHARVRRSHRGMPAKPGRTGLLEAHEEHRRSAPAQHRAGRPDRLSRTTATTCHSPSRQWAAPGCRVPSGPARTTRPWLAERSPLWPHDFDVRYFQSAPPDQVIPFPVGGEAVVLQNLSPRLATIAFTLPVMRMPVTFIPHRGRDLTLDSQIDTRGAGARRGSLHDDLALHAAARTQRVRREGDPRWPPSNRHGTARAAFRERRTTQAWPMPCGSNEPGGAPHERSLRARQRTGHAARLQRPHVARCAAGRSQRGACIAMA